MEKKLSRKERERLGHRQSILEAAKTLFSEKGYNHVTMQSIADEAEFAVGTIYTFFENKDDLYSKMLRETAEEFFNNIHPLLKKKAPPIEIIEEYLQTCRGFIMKHHTVLKIFLAETKGVKFAVKAHPDEYFQENDQIMEDEITAVIERGMKEGDFRKSDPRYAALALMGMLDSFFIKWVNSPQTLPDGPDMDFILEMFLNGLKEN